MAFIGSRIELGGSSNIISSSGGSNLIMSSSALISTGAMKISGSLVIEQTGADYFALNARNGPGSLSIYGKATANNYADLYMGNVVTVNPLWTFSVRSDSSFLYFGYNGGSFTNSMRLGMGGGTCIGHLAASVLPVAGVTHISEQVSIGGSSFNSPSARLHLAGGTNTVSSLRINSGVLLDTATTGSIEYDATNYYGTLAGPTRKRFLMSGDVTGTFNDVRDALLTTASVSLAGTLGAQYFASSSTGAGLDVFFFVSGTARTGYSSNFPAKRTLFNGDVLTSGTIQMLGAGLTSNPGSDTLLFVSGAIGKKDTFAGRAIAAFGGDLLISGVTYFGAVEESLLGTSSIGSGVSDFDVSQRTVFFLSGTTADFTANFTNVPTTNNRVISVNLLVTQSATARKPTAVQIAGTTYPLLWANGVTPTANANKLDIFGFSFVRYNSSWVSVVGQMSTYG